MAKDKSAEGIIHIRPKKKNLHLKGKLIELAGKEVRSYNEVGERILLDYFKKPYKLQFTQD